MVTKMEDLALHLYEIIKDYRIDDGFQMTPDRVLTWANQFKPSDRRFVLEELTGILEKKYLSKKSIVRLLNESIKYFVKKYNYNSPLSFLEHTVFLDLQEKGKSQKELLSLLDEILKAEYDIDLSFCGSKSVENYIYLDDILCTGNTVYFDLHNWLDHEEKGINQLEKLIKSKFNVILMYIFMHDLNLRKLEWRFKYSHPKFEFQAIRGMLIENDYEKVDSKLDFVFPVCESQPPIVLEYFNRLETSKYGVFRQNGKPSKEKFFSSPQNRIRFENILLIKGLEILNSVTVQKENIRPLGYTLPSHKNFGFGTLCFTWRNVPIIRHWYSGIHHLTGCHYLTRNR